MLFGSASLLLSRVGGWGGGGVWGWAGVEIIRIKAVLSSTGLELELSLAKIWIFTSRVTNVESTHFQYFKNHFIFG